MSSRNDGRSLNKRGSVMLMTAGIALFIVGMTAMVTDVGYLYYNQARLQTAVNAGWKAGFDKMMEIQKTGKNFEASDKALVVAHVKEVMKANGYSEAELGEVEIVFPNNSMLKVNSKQSVGLFFAKIFDISSADVAAGRENTDEGATIVPLGIPHGVTKDLSKNTYSCSLFSGTEGFTAGNEYILKLGEGDIHAASGTKMILVPMDANSQTNDGYLKAYGVAYWCLRIGGGGDPGYVPVYWLLGYRGGAFFLTYDAKIITQLNTVKVNYRIIEGAAAIQEIFDAVKSNILELYDRPRIAVYSSQEGADPVEEVLRAAYIPYGDYSMPAGYQRGAYDEDANKHIYDDEILNGVLDDYHWVHLHHEDFTGFNGGCSYYPDSCKDFFDNSRLGTQAAAQARMCTYCSSNYKEITTTSTVWDANKKKWVTVTSTAWGWDGSYNEAGCLLANTRCAERAGKNGILYRKDALVKTKICGTNADGSINKSFPQCTEYQRLVDIAELHGYISDPNSEPKPQTAVSTGNNGPGMSATQDGWFNRANKVQLMKFDVARTIRNHVEVGGFLFAQCFAPETLDIALWQAAVHDGIPLLDAFSDCFAFTGYQYRRFPVKYNESFYSTINALYAAGTSMPFNLLNPMSAKCQNHGLWPDTGSGHTAVFTDACINKDHCEVLGYLKANGTHAKYLSGKRGKGEFTFLGGHYHKNTESKRLVLNNILLGALVDKVVTGEPGKPKYNYGPLDPDNIRSSGGAEEDYGQRLKYGANIPVEANDRLSTESGNMPATTNDAVNSRTTATETYQAGRLVIIPITDIGPEIATNNVLNASAETIYDLQGKDDPGGMFRPDQFNFGSSVRVIGFALFEILPPSEFTRDGDEEGVLNYQDGDAGDIGPYQNGQIRGKFIKYIVNPSETQTLLN